MDIEDGRSDLPAITQQIAQHASSQHGDDSRIGRNRDEPAMAGIPAGAVQRMPEMASAGLRPCTR